MELLKIRNKLKITFRNGQNGPKVFLDFISGPKHFEKVVECPEKLGDLNAIT